ncbi:SCO family protein [Cytobacillus dafuensis]|uniref:SCO family protein n=1 Tax=Cytobacillus dafuensis TaxID=1742359 RepID=A0A5B8Z3K8_CYTDA|nr:SCO family protein [Cytobacillus dafuensis]QED46199.1 SCO family protein [Cytobacillus dafuensis]
MRVFVVAILLVAGFMAFYFFWPQSLDLPKIGHVKDSALTEVSGKEFSKQKKPKLITFFFTNCPDVCPTTIIDLKKLQKLMKEKGISDDQYLILAVTLDPEYDTKERILEYKNAFEISSSNWLFLRGSEEETKKFAQNFNMIYEKNQDGFVVHSTTMYVVDSNEQIRAIHDMATGDQRVNIKKIADHLIQLMD